MRICIILAPLFLGLALTGVLADYIAPRYPKLEEYIYVLLDKIM